MKVIKATALCLCIFLLAAEGQAQHKLLRKGLTTDGTIFFPRRTVLQDPLTDTDILNFALNLEYLEANFYSCAAFGKAIDQDLWGDNGMDPMGCKQAELTSGALAYAKAMAEDEIAHVRLLRQTLGSDAVDQPEIDIGAAFGAAADAAVGSTLSPSFSPYANDVSFFIGAFIFEDAGVTAYKGAAPLISNKGTPGVAAGVLAVEAYHGGAIRAKLIKASKQTIFPYESQVAAIIAAVSNLRASASGGDDDRGLIETSEQSQEAFVVAPGDKNAVAFSRTPSQVLEIVHLGAEKGGFFPQGTNGSLSPEPLSPAPPTDSSDSSCKVEEWALAILSIAVVAANLPGLAI
ncbi:putative desiccation-associated protein, precursor [Dunaliella salina]|uniref:Desiccation-associated protein n=1 Tax=Dunaliella salina TaxID=3046 RepID=A0ABQ7G3V3_DUNSA|nr:putative desiccation-associated protein, precursor [Dunaliella salina]|eukprot:KAF5829293.1 putative desiccation-associated protein, precursor [Dunaliella salina]